MVILDWKDFIFTLLNIEILKLLDFSGISVTGWARNWHVGDILPMKVFSVDQKKITYNVKVLGFSTRAQSVTPWQKTINACMPTFNNSLWLQRPSEYADGGRKWLHSTTSCLFFHSFNTHFLPASLPLPAGGIKTHHLPTGWEDGKNWNYYVTMTSNFYQKSNILMLNNLKIGSNNIWLQYNNINNVTTR